MITAIDEINALCADIQAKLSALSEQDQLRVAYKAGLVQSEFIRPVCDYLDDWILDAALRHARRFPDMAFMNLKNVQKAIRLTGF